MMINLLYHVDASNGNIMMEELLKSLEEKTKESMNNARLAWLLDYWYPSFWSYFKKRKECPPRFVSKAEADQALERLRNMDHRPSG